MSQLYIKHTSPKGRVTYQPFPHVENASMELDNKEVVTILTSVGMCLTQSITRFLPYHSRINRNVTDVEKALLKLSKGAAGPLDEHLIQVGASGFNAAVQAICDGLAGGREIIPSNAVDKKGL